MLNCKLLLVIVVKTKNVLFILMHHATDATQLKIASCYLLVIDVETKKFASYLMHHATHLKMTRVNN